MKWIVRAARIGRASMIGNTPYSFFRSRGSILVFLWYSLVGLLAAEPVYLFSSFRGNGEDGLRLAYSRDGLHWTALKGDQPLLTPTVGDKLMRDPCIIKGPKGDFHMVWTTSWADKGIGIAHSKDLIDWTEQQMIPVMEGEEKARNCWAPEISWDPESQHYLIYWATTISDQFLETEKAADKGWNHRIYCTTTKDFKSYTETRLFYQPGFNVIDSTISHVDGRYVMVSKDETRYPPAKNLFIATAKHMRGPWVAERKPFSPVGLWVEGPTVAQIGDYSYVYYDCYKQKRYGVMRTKDFVQWENLSAKLKMPKGMRHGTVLEVSEDVLTRLLEWTKKK